MKSIQYAYDDDDNDMYVFRSFEFIIKNFLLQYYHSCTHTLIIIFIFINVEEMKHLAV